MYIIEIETVNILIWCMASYFITEYNTLDSDSIMLEKCNFVHEKSLKSPWISFLKKRCGNHVISDSLSASVIAVSYVLSWHIRPCYNSTWLYFAPRKKASDNSPSLSWVSHVVLFVSILGEFDRLTMGLLHVRIRDFLCIVQFHWPVFVRCKCDSQSDALLHIVWKSYIISKPQKLWMWLRSYCQNGICIIEKRWELQCREKWKYFFPHSKDMIMFIQRNASENVICKILNFMITLHLSLHPQRVLSLCMFCQDRLDGSVQHCGNSITNALELPQSCAKPSI